MNYKDRIRYVHLSMAIGILKPLIQGMINEHGKENCNFEQMEGFVESINQSFNYIEEPLLEWNRLYGKKIEKEMKAEERMFAKMEKNE